MTGQMEASLVQQLVADVALTECLKVVGHLRALHVLREEELRVLFLQARNAFLEKVGYCEQVFFTLFLMTCW